MCYRIYRLIGFLICLISSLSVNAQNIVAKDYSQLPIKSSRTISFTTNEGSYMDVDISPDGSSILFSLLGDLYKIPVTGGIAEQLTRGLPINKFPTWSPNGKLIAYKSDATGSNKIHIRSLSGKFHKVLDNGQFNEGEFMPKWLPNSKEVLVGKLICHINGNTSQLQKDVSRILNFSSDGQFIFYLDNVYGDSTSLIRLNRNRHEEVKILTISKASWQIGNPIISPNANWLAYIKVNDNLEVLPDSLILVDVRTGNEKLLASFYLKAGGTISHQQYTFSHDSKSIIIGYGGKIHKINVETGANEIIPFTANVKVNMGSLNYNQFHVALDSLEVKYVRSVDRSPDGKHIVFSALNKIYTMDLASGRPKILINQSVNQFAPKYSPDGKWIAFVTWSDIEGGHLWRVSSEGGEPEKITTSSAAVYLNPSWSPDGRMIVVAVKDQPILGRRDNPGIGRIVTVSLSDRTIKSIAEKVPLFNRPMFSADGKSVLFIPSQIGSGGKVWPALVSHELRSNKLKIIATSLNNTHIRQVTCSPDKKFLVFMYNENLYLSAINDTINPKLIVDEIGKTTMIRFAVGGVDPNWEHGGKFLSWTVGNQYHRIATEEIIKKIGKGFTNTSLKSLEEKRVIDVNIPSERPVNIGIKVPRLYEKGLIALIGARVVTLQNRKVIENGTIVIKDGRFIEISESDKIKIPQEAIIVNVEGKTIIPGLIDMHSHMYDAVPPDIFLQQSWQRLLNLLFGVTTIRDLSGSFDTFGYSEAIETGQMIGPRLFTVGHAVRPHYSITNKEEAKVIVDNRVRMGAIVIKQYLQNTRLQKQLLLLACKEARVNMTNEGGSDPYVYLGMIKDGSAGVEHNPDWGDVYSDVIKFIAKSGTFITPTLQVSHRYRDGKSYFRNIYGENVLNGVIGFIPEDTKRYQFQNLKNSNADSGFLSEARIDGRIKKEGGKILMGSHGEDQGIGAHYELWALQKGGLSIVEALEAGTIEAANGLGLQKDLGSIAVGKIADLIILDKNPLDDIHNTISIKYVMKSGVFYDRKKIEELSPEIGKRLELQKHGAGLSATKDSSLLIVTKREAEVF